MVPSDMHSGLKESHKLSKEPNNDCTAFQTMNHCHAGEVLNIAARTTETALVGNCLYWADMV